MVPSNADAVDRTATLPSVLNAGVDLNALKDRETLSQPEANGAGDSAEQKPLIEDSSASAVSGARNHTAFVRNGSSVPPPEDEGHSRTGGPVDVTMMPAQNGVHTVDQQAIKASTERKAKRPEGSHLERGHGPRNGHKQRKANDLNDQHMNDSLHAHPLEEDADEENEDENMDASQLHSEAKYKRLKRKLKEVLEENDRLSVALERSNRRARNLRQEKNQLLDRLCSYERDSDSSIDTVSTLSSDSESSDSSLTSAYQSRKSSPIRAAPPATNKHLQVPRAKKEKASEAPALQTVHHPKKTATKAAAGRRSPAVSGRKDDKPVSIPSTITNVGSATQKPKRLHNTSKLKPILSKVRKVQPIEKDESGNVKLPVTVGIITIMSLGHVVHDREAFHNERYIWPVGYKMSRLYNSMIDPTLLTTYTCSVIDDGEAPKFQIDAEDQPGKPIIAGTATGAWTHIVKTANSIRKRDHSNSASGPDYFGFSNATIAKMIQDLPDADKCKSYIMQRFEESTAKTPSTPEKRKISSAGGSKASKGGGEEGHGGQEEDEEDEDNDAYASLGTPGKKVKRSPSPKIRNASLGYGAKDGEDVEMEEAEEDEGGDELDELEDEETQSEGDQEGDTSLVAETEKMQVSEEPGSTATSTAATPGPSIVITSADKAAASGKSSDIEGASELETTQTTS
ncbi:MAG: hypothetical protein J3Q66DRAFT_347526 [Benniella sp.]|nr:MAG: hypothetical protein J3Q66DRAFT_347526 [Benniella sp.]